MYRVRVEFPQGGLSITNHHTAVDTQARMRDVRRWGGCAVIENAQGERVSEAHLEVLVAEESSRPVRIWAKAVA
jgi:hypothetical protein